MAAMRFDEMPDQIEKVLYSSLMDRAVPDPSLQNTFMGATLDTLASDTWDEVTVGECVSPKATTLLKPEDCKSLWMNFIEEIKPMVNGARSRQDARRKTREGATTAATAILAAAVTVIGSLNRR
ncbi:protein ROOT HAIR DEFECTIVE 3 homolog 2-like [Populus alba]|uniref:protein ROOT HAIR DEFECTIVE 3 homolog 2-like n=1 Tax=Populus alba TaxID=43335 RepID=UPI003CC70DC8